MMRLRDFKIIPQEHLGIRFRSRTEARWAEFFVAQDIPFSYEPDAIGDGISGYLVDFQFTEADRLTYFEVKPTTPTENEYRKLSALAKAMKAHVFVAHGQPSHGCRIEKVLSTGARMRWYFAYAHEGSCGYLVNDLYACKHAIALRKVSTLPGMYGFGPDAELDRAGRFQFDGSSRSGRGVLTRRVWDKSPGLMNSFIVRELMAEKAAARRVLRKDEPK